LTPVEIAARLADPARRDRIAPTGSDDAQDLMPERRTQAAVLVPIILHDAPTVMLTLRAAAMSSHAGQVSFPGGRIEAEETPEAAALREAAEEVGLDPRQPELIGRLPEHRTGTGFHVTPVVALVPVPLTLTPEPAEVAEIFEYPLAALLRPGLAQRQKREFKGRTREFWVIPHERHYIWGATAAILVNLSKLLRD
jgi:8-oxo-dGTP pyrophosphatase MutT (NUDIX family)